MLELLRKLIRKPKPALTRQARNQALIDQLRRDGMKIGSDVWLINSIFDSSYPFLIEIGNRVIVTHATVLAHDASPTVFGPWSRTGRVRILDECFIGAGSVVLPGVTIGPHAIVGACAVVTRDVPLNAIVGGNPTRIIGQVDEWLERKKQTGEMIPWNASFVPDDAELDRAINLVRQKYDLGNSGAGNTLTRRS